MDEADRILLFGASTRAAAFSALRAGLRPWCVDLFADRDLRARCPALRAHGPYPDSFLAALQSAPPGPWMYTGGLENHPRLVQKMSGQRELWGNDAATLRRARNPLFVAEAVRAAGLPVPAVRQVGQTAGTHGVASDARWLLKPLRSVGGRDIAFWTGDEAARADSNKYIQEFITGVSAAAIYVGDGRAAHLLGVTYQLTGELFCHARAFQYCGSVGPVEISEGLRANLVRLGDVLTAACQLHGLFGVDGVVRDDLFWPVEVNPRYTASVEVLEYATGLRALARHRAVFGAASPGPSPGGTGAAGKAILFARSDEVFPAEGPWDAAVQATTSPHEMPAFADIPEPGARIKAGRPILTLLARGETVAACLDDLRQRTAALDRRLFGS